MTFSLDQQSEGHQEPLRPRGCADKLPEVLGAQQGGVVPVSLPQEPSRGIPKEKVGTLTLNSSHTFLRWR